MKNENQTNGEAFPKNELTKEEPKSSTERTTKKLKNNNGDNSKTISIGSTFGKGLSSFSDFVNDNLIAFRYGTFATVTLLTAYGLSQTPLFFRYRTVSEIPKSYFGKRRTIHGRIVHVVDEGVGIKMGKGNNHVFKSTY